MEPLHSVTYASGCSDEAPGAEIAQARRAPTLEVVAKPTRRQFTASTGYGSSRRPTAAPGGEVGRLLRREGLYTSHLSAWRKVRRNGSLQGLTPKKRGAKPAEPPQRQGPPARIEGGAP